MKLKSRLVGMTVFSKWEELKYIETADISGENCLPKLQMYIYKRNFSRFYIQSPCTFC